MSTMKKVFCALPLTVIGFMVMLVLTVALPGWEVGKRLGLLDPQNPAAQAGMTFFGDPELAVTSSLTARQAVWLFVWAWALPLGMFLDSFCLIARYGYIAPYGYNDEAEVDRRSKFPLWRLS